MRVKINETEYDVTDVFDLTNVISELHKVWWVNAVEEVKEEFEHDDSVKEDILNNLTHAQREEIADDFAYTEYGYESVDKMECAIEEYKSTIDEIHEMSRV